MADNFLKRGIRIAYWDSQKKYFDRHKAALELHLKQLTSMQIINMNSLDDPELKPCDLLVIAAEHLSGEEFTRWIAQTRTRLARQNDIRIPALIFANISFAAIAGMMSEAVADNWYFDIVAPSGLNSLPIRVANLLRIHDHLHEMQRYDANYKALQTRLSEIEDKLKKIPGVGS